MADKTALVISGGGAKGAYAVGALSVIQEHQTQFDIYAGTSTGALISPFAMFPERLGDLRHSYQRAEVSQFLWPVPLAEVLQRPAVFDTTPYRRTLEAKVTEDLWNQISTSPAQLLLSAVSLQSGQLWFFHTHEKPDHPLAQFERITSRAGLIDAMQASGSMPVFMPPVDIAIAIAGGTSPTRTHQFGDGGLATVIPVAVAKAAGATKLVVIALRPRNPAVEPGRYGNTIAVLKRVLDIYDLRVGLADCHVMDEADGTQVLEIAPSTDLPDVTLSPSADAMAALMAKGAADAKAAIRARSAFFPTGGPII